MKQAKQPVIVALYGLLAVIWLAVCVREAVTTGQVEGLRVLTAVVWSFCFAVYLGRYLRQ